MMDSQTTIVRKSFADNLKELRGDMSQSELAEALGASRGSISMYESGHRTADIEFAYTVCRYFGVAADWLLGLSSVKKPDTTIQAVCDLTGLEATAVEKLRTAVSVKRKHGYDVHFPELISGIIQSEESDRLANKIWRIVSESNELSEIYDVPYFSLDFPTGEKMRKALKLEKRLSELYGPHTQILGGEDYFDYAITSAKSLASEIVAELIDEKAIRAVLDTAMEDYKKRIEEAENGDRGESRQ